MFHLLKAFLISTKKVASIEARVQYKKNCNFRICFLYFYTDLNKHILYEETISPTYYVKREYHIELMFIFSSIKVFTEP